MGIYSNNPIGVMQGRLVPPEPGRFQSFPRERWRDEFPNAKVAGVDYIEWIVDSYAEEVNPLFTEAGLAELDALKQRCGISTPALCADWFMDYPLLRCNHAELADRVSFLHRLIPAANRIGAGHIVLPFVDISRIETEEDKSLVVDLLTTTAPIAEANGVELHLETDLNAREFAALLARIPHPSVWANYDSGNSSGLGYIASEEFAAYGHRIGSIHIKDRARKSGGRTETRPLGQGSADFADVFASIRQIGYDRGLTLQVARGQDGDEVAWIRKQIEFVKRGLRESPGAEI